MIIATPPSPSWMQMADGEESRSGFSRSPTEAEHKPADNYAKLVANLIGLEPVEVPLQDKSPVPKQPDPMVRVERDVIIRKERKDPTANLRAFVAAPPIQVREASFEKHTKPWWHRHWQLIAAATGLTTLFMLGMLIFFLTPRALRVQVMSIKPLSDRSGAYQLTKKDGILRVAIGSQVEVQVANPGWRSRTVDGVAVEIWWLSRSSKESMRMGRMEMSITEHPIKAKQTTIITVPAEITFEGSIHDDPLFMDYLDTCQTSDNIIRVEYRIEVGHIQDSMKAKGKGKRVQALACPLVGAQLQALRQ